MVKLINSMQDQIIKDTKRYNTEASRIFYSSNNYDLHQYYEAKLNLYKKLDHFRLNIIEDLTSHSIPEELIMLAINRQFNEEQMKIIVKGIYNFDNPNTVRIYAHPKFSATEMEIIYSNICLYNNNYDYLQILQYYAYNDKKQLMQLINKEWFNKWSYTVSLSNHDIRFQVLKVLSDWIRDTDISSVLYIDFLIYQNGVMKISIPNVEDIELLMKKFIDNNYLKDIQEKLFVTSIYIEMEEKPIQKPLKVNKVQSTPVKNTNDIIPQRKIIAKTQDKVQSTPVKNTIKKMGTEYKWRNFDKGYGVDCGKLIINCRSTISDISYSINEFSTLSKYDNIMPHSGIKEINDSYCELNDIISNSNDFKLYECGLEEDVDYIMDLLKNF